jgi:hypothetical protein
MEATSILEMAVGAFPIYDVNAISSSLVILVGLVTPVFTMKSYALALKLTN